MRQASTHGSLSFIFTHPPEDFEGKKKVHMILSQATGIPGTAELGNSIDVKKTSACNTIFLTCRVGRRKEFWGPSFEPLFEFARDEVHLSVRCFLLLPHLARLSRLYFRRLSTRYFQKTPLHFAKVLWFRAEVRSFVGAGFVDNGKE